MGRAPRVVVGDGGGVRLFQQRLGGVRDRKRPLPQGTPRAGRRAASADARVRAGGRRPGAVSGAARRGGRGSLSCKVPTEQEILSALSRVIDPELRKPVTELDMVRAVGIDGGDVTVTIALTIAGCPLRNSFQDQVS